MTRLFLAVRRPPNRAAYSLSIAIFVIAGSGSFPYAQEQTRQLERAGTPQARAAYAAAAERVEQLRTVKSTVYELRRSVFDARVGLTNVRGWVEISRKAVDDSSAAIAEASRCRTAVTDETTAALRTIAEFRDAAQQALARAAELSRTSTSVVALLPESTRAFERRHDKKRELTALVSRLPNSVAECSTRLSAADKTLNELTNVLSQVNSGTQATLAAVDLVRRAGASTMASVSSARIRRWLPTSADVGVVPPTPALARLRDRVVALDGIAMLELRDPQPEIAERLREYQDAALRLVVEQDAQQFLLSLALQGVRDCRASECTALFQEVFGQRWRVDEARSSADSRLLDLERTLGADAGLGVLAPDTSAWTDVQRAVEDAFALAHAEVVSVLDAANTNAEALEKIVDAALEKAIAERRSAYLRVFGVLEPPEPRGESDDGPVTGGGAGGGALYLPPRVAPSITRHAFEVLTLRGTESAGYGAYTYAILPVRGSDSPDYAALLHAIVDLTAVALATDAPAVRKVTNLFIIPGNSAEPIPPDATDDFAKDVGNYDWSRALSLVQLASAGVLARGEVLNTFRRSPGPFLLTLPVPIEQATATTNLLLADLHGYPASGFKDLVTSYKNDLVDAFPTNQRVWRPPWALRTALTLVRVASMAGGQNLVALVQR